MNPAAANSGDQRHLVAVPYPGRGHINPMLNLCKLIASKSPHLSITVMVTEEWCCPLAAGGSEPEWPPNLQLGAMPQVIPSEVGRAGNFTAFLEAIVTKMEAPFEELLDRLEPPATAILYDTYLIWAAEVAGRRSLPAAALWTSSASMFTLLSHFDLLVKNGHSQFNVERRSEVVDYIPGLPPTAVSDFPTHFDGDVTRVAELAVKSVHYISNVQFLLLPSIPDLEGSAIEALKSKFPTTTVLPIGPMIPYFNQSPPTTADSDHYLRWLDRQPEKSVLYISTGSFLSTSNAQMDEIVAGILDSGVRYLWVTRDEDSRFEIEGGEKRGCLVEWCDQFRVLSNRAVGGFWSHCGWNSTSEAAFTGTPVLTFPILWDQMLNAKMVAEDWRFGRRVRKAGLITREEIKRIVGEFMDVAGEGRREMEATAGRVSQSYRRAVGSGGSAADNIDAFVEEISRFS